MDVTIPSTRSDEIFRRIFEEDRLVGEVHRARGTVGMRFGGWSVGREEGSMRTLEYDVAFKAPFMRQSTTACIEQQEVVSCGDGRFTVSSIIRTPSVPFGKSFSTVVRYCITYNSTSTELKVTMNVKFQDSVWMKSHIKSSAITNTTFYFTDLLSALSKPQTSSPSTSPTRTTKFQIPPRSSSVPPSLRHLLPPPTASETPSLEGGVEGLRRRTSTMPTSTFETREGGVYTGGSDSSSDSNSGDQYQYHVGSMLSQIPIVVAVVAGGLVMWVLQGLGY